MGPRLSVEEILDITRGVLISGRPDGAIEGITIDSREVIPGQLFVPLRGNRFDGHDFVFSALEQGAGGAIVEREMIIPAGEKPVILVADTLAALGDIARNWREKFRGPVIAITGSTGKTTTKEMTAIILSERWVVHKSEGNYNNLIGIPLTVFNLTPAHELIVVELGTNRPGEIARLGEITEPTIACVTNVGPAHLEGLGSMDGVAREKGELFFKLKDNGIAVVNVDDPYVREMATKTGVQTVTFGWRNDALVTVRGDVEVTEGKTAFTLVIGNESAHVTLAATGEHNVYNALAAAAISWAAGARVEDIVSGLVRYRPMPGRMEILTLKGGIHLINDVYNANPASCEAALRTLRQLRKTGKSFVILGDMLELGGEGEQCHERVGHLLVETGVTQAYLRGDLVKYVARGAYEEGWQNGQAIIFRNGGEIVGDLCARIEPGDWILVKGSRGTKMEEVVNEIVRCFGLAEEGAP